MSAEDYPAAGSLRELVASCAVIALMVVLALAVIVLVIQGWPG